MAGSLNKVQLLGNLGQDPEIRSFPNGGRVANLSIATSETWKDKNTGEKKERTEWHRVAVFVDGLIGIVEQYLRKGSKVYLEGQLETRKWQDQSGQDRYTTEIVLRPYAGQLILLPNAQGGGQAAGQAAGQGGGQQNGGGYGGPMQGGQAAGGQGGAGGPAGFPDDRGGPGGGYGGGRNDIDDEIPF